MMREYDEKRDFIRIDIDCEIIYKKLDAEGCTGEESAGQVSNLSGRGLMFISDVEIDENSMLEINIKPSNILTPSLHANVKVVRVVKQRHAGGFEIGAVIKEVHEEK